MIRINLLPFRAARRKENVRRQISIFLLSLVLISAGLLWYSLHLRGRINSLNDQVKNTQIALNEKKAQVAEADLIKKQLDTLTRKTNVITDLATRRKEAVVLLDSMPELIINKRMWFERLEEKGSTVDIHGIALDNKTVADFMTRLEESPHYNQVRLKSTKVQKIDDYNLMSFIVSLERVPLGKTTAKENGANKS